MGGENPPGDLPGGAYVDRGDADVWVLRRPDGSVIARFWADAADEREIYREALEDSRRPPGTPGAGEE